jgi:hypothetical protein
VASRLDRLYFSTSLMPSVHSADIHPCSVSDHDYVSVKLKDFEGIDFGPSYWKCNNSILDSAFKFLFTAFCENNIPSLDNITLEWWDTFKKKIQKFIILVCKTRKRSRVSLINDLKAQFRNLSRAESSNPGSYVDQISELKKQLKDLEIIEFHGHVVRSKAADLENGENPSSYFLRKEAKRGQKKSISSILDTSGNVKTTSLDILEVFANFHSTQFRSEDIDPDICDFFLSDVPKLDKERSDLLEGEISKEELLSTIKAMQNNSSPGPDGLTKEFYLFNFDVLGDVLLRVVHLCFLKGTLPSSSTTSYISLICKDENNAENVRNWRPISLLNVDLKMISKTLCTRLGLVIEDIIHLDQTCGVPGRSIHDNCHLIRNVLDYVEQKGLSCAFISLDLEKAFDRVSHEWIHKVLDSYGLGPVFKKWVKILYTDISSSIIVNQHISRPFPVMRSVRQGCGLSAVLYALTLEPLFDKLRKDQDIIGVKLPGSNDSAKISAYADDGLGFCTTDASIKNLLDLYTHFGKASGSKLNKQKTKGVFVGKWKSRSDHPFGISWIEQSKVVGIFTGQNVTADDQFCPILTKFRKVLNSCNGRSMSIFGKSTVCNVLALSQMWYRASAVPISKHYVDLFQRETFRFIWHSTAEPIRRSVLYKPILEGGLGVIHIQTKLQAFLLRHLQALINNSSAKWTYFAIYWLGLSLRRYRPAFASLLIPHSESIPLFYQQCFSALKLFETLDSTPLVNIETFNVKQFYQCLLKKVTENKIERIYPQINFQEVWRNLHHKFVDCLPKSVNFRLIYDSLPLGYVLFVRHIALSPDCVLCNSAVETSDHLFIDCPCANVLWSIVIPWLNQLSSGLIQKRYEIIRFGLLPKIPNSYYHAVCLYLLAVAKSSIWQIRNLVKFEHKRLNGNDIVLRFLSHVKTRIRADYFRLSHSTFHKYWVSSNIFCFIDANYKLQFNI